MKNFKTMLLALAISLAGCTRASLMPSLHPRNIHDNLSHPTAPGEEIVTGRKDTCIYSLAVEYPASYDWQRDSAYGNVACRLVVFRNQKRLLETDAGPGTLISPETDMNRLEGGHLYSDFSSGTHTSISLDGQELFNYEGREMIRGFRVLGNDVITLGQSRSGKGLSLRRNGEVLFTDREGILPGYGNVSGDKGGLLGMDGDRSYFWYRNAEGGVALVVDGQKQTVRIPPGMTEVHCVALDGGDVCIIGSASIRGRFLLYKDDGLTNLDCAQASTLYTSDVTDCRVIRRGGSSFICLQRCSTYDANSETTVWEISGKRLFSRQDVAALRIDVDGKISHVRTDSNGYVSFWNTDGKEKAPDRREKLIGPMCMGLSDGLFCISTSPADKSLNPVLRVGDKKLALMVNGYVFCLEISESQQ